MDLVEVRQVSCRTPTSPFAILPAGGLPKSHMWCIYSRWHLLVLAGLPHTSTSVVDLTVRWAVFHLFVSLQIIAVLSLPRTSVGVAACQLHCLRWERPAFLAKWLGVAVEGACPHDCNIRWHADCAAPVL